MSSAKTLKICIIGNSLAKGGAEKVHSVLSNVFFEEGFSVDNVIFIDDVSYNFSGSLLNLGALKNKSNDFFNKLHRLKTLYQFIKNNNFDVIIDNRYREHQFQELFFSRFIFTKNYIPVIHSYRLKTYFPKNKFLAKILHKNASKIVSVSKAGKQNIEDQLGYNNVITIYNPIEIDKIERLSKESISINFDYIIALGRMAQDNVKQQDVLIKAYSKSLLPSLNIKLVLVGDGVRRSEFEKLASDLNLSDKIIFTGFKDNPFPYVANAKFSVLTSKHEGFPNAITESLACGTPVVSFNCKSGPNEVIVNGYNGLLVKDQDQEDLIASFNLMVTDNDLYNNCKLNSRDSVLRFSTQEIVKEWIHLFNSL